MNARTTLHSLLAVLLLLHAATASAAVFLVPDDRTMILEADAIVMGLITHQETAVETNRDIVTISHFAAEDVIKGSFPLQSSVAVRDLGGIHGTRAMGVSAGVSYAPGERALIFLDQKEDGSWTTYGMMLGKMKSMRDRDGEAVLVREMQGAVGLSPDGRTAHVEQPRTEGAFLSYMRRLLAVRAASGVDPQRLGAKRDIAEPEPDYFHRRRSVSGGAASTFTAESDSTFTPVTDSHYPPSAYTQGTFRWDRFDAGQTVTYYISGTQPGHDSVGAAQRALAAWTNDSGSNVSLAYGGTRTNRFVEDDVNTIVYNSSTDVPAGAIGYAKWYANATHTYKGVTFYSISEGDVVIKAGISVSAAVFQEAVSHELGHTLGFRHSDQGTPSSTDAVMRSVVTGRYGTTLGSWDTDAVRHVYTSTVTTPPPCTPPAVTSQTPPTSVTEGDSITLNVTATGTGPLTYQWFIGASGSTTSPILNSNTPSYTVTPGRTASYWVRVTNACGTAASNTITITVNSAQPTTTTTRGDFNFDGRSDLIWRNRATGANRVWYLNNTTIIGTAAMPALSDTNWTIGGAGELNGDGRQDLVWHNNSTGANAVWFMNGTTQLSSATLRATGPEWYIGSVMNYDRNGTSDIVWRHRVQPYTFLWLMTGTTMTSSTALKEAPAAWELIGSGDFNSDLWQDLVFRNVTTDQVYIWFMAGTNLQSSTSLPLADADTWAAGAIGDMNLDGFPDIVWRNKLTGANVVWYVAGGVFRGSASLPTDGDLTWEIVGPR